MELVVIAITAFLTSILSALAGLGGGIILLAVIAQFFPPVIAIPIHGGIQLVSNGSRAIMLRGNINWSAVARSSILLFPASMLGVLVAASMPVDATRLLLGCFVLVLVWRPDLVKWRGRNAIDERSLVVVGAASGFINTTVGASGPFTSPFFRAVTATHTAFVATAACSQVLAHSAKLGAFILLNDFDLRDHALLIAVSACCVTLGSWVGTRLLGRIEERHLAIVFKVVLTILAIRLIVRALL